jgi:exodeoxyribonuclease VII small subunit
MTRDKKSSPPDSAAEQIPIEKALARIEEIARRLEGGDLPLEESLTLFEEGVALTRRLDARLAEAEMKVEALIRGAGGAEEVVPLEPPEKKS